MRDSVIEENLYLREKLEELRGEIDNALDDRGEFDQDVDGIGDEE